MYKVLTILPAGKSYLIRNNTFIENNVDTLLQHNAIQNSNYTYCDAMFIDKSTTKKIFEAVKKELLKYDISDSKKIEYN